MTCIHSKSICLVLLFGIARLTASIRSRSDSASIHFLENRGNTSGFTQAGRCRSHAAVQRPSPGPLPGIVVIGILLTCVVPASAVADPSEATIPRIRAAELPHEDLNRTEAWCSCGRPSVRCSRRPPAPSPNWKSRGSLQQRRGDRAGQPARIRRRRIARSGYPARFDDSAACPERIRGRGTGGPRPAAGWGSAGSRKRPHRSSSSHGTRRRHRAA